MLLDWVGTEASDAPATPGLQSASGAQQRMRFVAPFSAGKE